MQYRATYFKNGGGTEAKYFNTLDELNKYKDEWFTGIDDFYVNRPFIDTARVMSKDDFMETCPFIANYKDIKTINADKKTAQIPIKETYYYIDKMYFNLINKFDIDIVGCYSDNEIKILPLFFKGKDFEIVAMPMSVTRQSEVVK